MGAGIRTGILPLRLLQLLQGTTRGAQNNCILSDLSIVLHNFIITCDSIAEIENIIPGLNDICGHPSGLRGGKILNENGESSHLLK